ncbi:MAG: hypothetical protein WC828_09795 [Thermoleophilia bacterium]|jgi:hypothetical protein
MKSDRANIMAVIQIMFGIIIFTSSFWLSDSQKGTGLLVFGFVTVLLGVVTGVLTSSKK